MKTQSIPKFTSSILLLAALLIVLLPAVSAQSEETTETPEFTGEPIYIGVSGPLTGPTAQYGAQWIKGFDLAELGLKNLAVLQLTNDWGLATYDLFEPRVTELGGNIVALESYLPDEVDFRSALTNIQNANPDGIILISYTPDAALIAQQVQEAGLNIPLIGSGAIQQADLIALGGEAVEGAYVLGQFLPSDPRPLVQTFVENYRAKYEEDPDLFATIAYDTMILISEAIKLGGATREGVHEALAELEGVPSVLYGSITFDIESRRVLNPEFVGLTIQEGEFVPLEATEATPEAS
jgi:branched-chain amino acid transport system substrate-binding protein